MTKREQIINIIRQYDDQIAWRGEWVWRVAGEVECSTSTVYRAIAHLKEIGAMDENNRYTGRVPSVDEIKALVSAAGGDEFPVMLTDERLSEWAQVINCRVSDLRYWLTLRWFSWAFEFPRGGAYGLMIRNKAA